jgi:uncharacterized protein (DUF1810 family)
MADFDLDRFAAAQDPVWPAVLAELRAGAKRTHWMWFVFPQLAGLGRSPMARAYSIGSLAEARAYLDHPVLGPRLVEATRLVMAVEGRTLTAILGTPDDLKFRSSMTLFDRARPEEPPFRTALDRFCGGVPDRATLRLLGLP